jgi:hypothetical protein
MIDKKTCVMDDIKKSSETYNNEGDDYQQPPFELTNKQLIQAIMYSEIFGKPKCKTRRRR